MKSLKIPDNKIYNAYLIEGEDMELIKESALAFAENLLLRCETEDGDKGEIIPIYQERGYDSKEEWADSVRKRVGNNEHPDLIRIFPDRPEDNPTTVSVGNIRDNVTNTVEIRPYEALYKIYIIEHAECMNQQAQNIVIMADVIQKKEPMKVSIFADWKNIITPQPAEEH